MLKKILIITPLVLIFIAVTIVVLHWRTRLVSDSIQKVLKSSVSGVDISYDEVRGDLFQNIIVTGLELRFKNGTALHSNRVTIRYDLFSTISEEYHFDLVDIDSIWFKLHTSEADTAAGRPMNEILNDFSGSAWYQNMILNLPDISVRNLSIGYGNLTDDHNSFTIDEIRTEMSGKVLPGQIEASVKKLSGEWVDHQLRINGISFRLTGNEKRFTLNHLDVETQNSYIRAAMDAEITDRFQVILGLSESRIRAGDLTRLFHLTWLDSGDIKLSGQLIGMPGSFNADLQLAANINQYHIKSLSVTGAYDNGAIKLERVVLGQDAGRLELDGRILTGQNRLNLKFVQFDLNRYFTNMPVTSLNGRVSATLSGYDPETASGTFNLLMTQTGIDSLVIDTVQLGIRYTNGIFTIGDSSSVTIRPDSKFYISGTVDRRYAANLNLHTEENSMHAFAGFLGLKEVEGRLDGNFFVNGNLLDPDIEGYLWFPYGKYHELEMDSLILQVKLDRILSNRKGDAFLSISRGNIDNFEFTQTHAEILFDSNQIILDSLLFAQQGNYFSTAGKVEFISDTIVISLDNFRLYYASYWIRNNGEIRIRIDPKELDVEQALFMAPDSGVLEIRGYWDRVYQEIQTGLLLRNMQIGPLRQFFGPGVDLQGVVEGDFELIDPLTRPELDIDLRGWKLQYNGAPFGDVSCSFKYLDHKFYFEQFKMVYDSTQVELDGDISIEVGGDNGPKGLTFLEKSAADVNLTWNNISLKNYRSILNLPRLAEGMVSGRMALLGTLVDPVGSIVLRGHDIVYDKFRADTLESYFRFNRDSLRLEKLSIVLNGTSIQADGWLAASFDLTNPDTALTTRPFELNIHSEDDTLAFIGFLTDQVERLRGPFNMNFTLTGSLSDPALKKGDILVDDAVVELTRVMNPITDVNLEARIEDNRMEIEHFSAYAARDKDFWDQLFSIPSRIFELFGVKRTPDGVVSGHGTILFDRLAHPYVDLSLEMSRLYINYFVENTQLVLSSQDLHVAGRDTLKVTGSLDVSGKFVVDLPTLKRNMYLSGSELKGQTRYLTWDLDINIPGNFMVTSSAFDLANNFQIDITGDIHAIQEAGRPTMELTGFLNTNSGRYRSWGQNFEVKSGNISFNDPNVINPDINITAEKISRGMTFELTIQGNLEKQQLDLQVKDENDQYLNYTNSDKITLLSLGTTSDQLSAADLTTAGEDVIKTSVETAFSHGAESLTGLDKVELDMSSSLVDLQSMKLNNGLKDASLLLGKYVFSNLYLEYRSQFGGGTIPAPKLSWEPGNQIGLKYRINRDWSVDSNYALTQRGNNMIQISLSWKKTF
jgi:hypothetical protein